MKACRVILLTSLVLFALPGGRLLAWGNETSTIASATEVLTDLAGSNLACIPPVLLRDAQGVAIIPNVLKAGFVIGGRHGRGVLLIRQPDGCWSNPIFVSLTGGSFGWQIGVQSTDIVLVFKTHNGLDRIMQGKGKLTLGADVAVAAGPVGRQVEAGTDALLKAEIYSYSRSRGLFAGLSVEGAGLLIDDDADVNFYRALGVRPADILSGRVPVPVAAEQLKGELSRLAQPPAPPVVVPSAPVAPPVLQPPQPPPPPPAPPQ
jgi:lipid-binding SYLF domain-containing protein